MTTRSLKLAKDLSLPLDTVRKRPGPPRKPARHCSCGRVIKRLGKHLRCQSCAAKQRPRRPRLLKEEKLRRRRVMAAKWRAKNREKIREYFRVYDAQNKEARKERYRKNAVALRARARIRKATAEARAKAREYRIANRTRRNAARRAWGRKNPERAKAIERRRRERNREQRRAANRLYRQQNPEIYKASIARAKAAKPDLYAHIAVNSAMTRRARKRRVHVERVSPRRVFTRDGWRCHLCSESIDRPHRSLDHLIPIVRGGAHAEWNLMAAHVRCNQRRGTKQILTEETKEAAVAYIVARTASQETAA